MAERRFRTQSRATKRDDSRDPLPRIETVRLSRLRPAQRNAHQHSKKQIRQLADSIERFGFINPVITDDQGVIVAGHGRVEAAKLLEAVANSLKMSGRKRA
jgi:hypothetical protein